MANINLPFDDQHVWEFLKDNSYCSERYKLLYVATPKVACTTLKWWFANLEGYSELLSKITDSRESDPDLIIHDSFHKIAPSVTKLQPNMLIEPLESEEFFRFAVVRNPYKRIFSAWQSKLLLREPIQSKAYLNCDFFWLPLKNMEDIAKAFEGFLEHLAANEAPNYVDYHWTPQTNLLRTDLIAYTDISQIEDIRNLKLKLAKHLGSDTPEPFAQHRANESLIPYLPEFITERSGELIRSLYQDDFQSFRYNESPPDAKNEYSSVELDVAIQAIGLIRGRHKRLGDMFEQLITRDEKIVNLNEQIATLNEQIVNRNEQIATLNGQIVNRNEQIVTLNEQIVNRNEQIATLNEQIVNRNEQIATYKHPFIESKEAPATSNASHQNKSWKRIDILRKIYKLIWRR